MRSSSPSEVPRPREVRRQRRALSPRGEPVRSPAPASFFLFYFMDAPDGVSTCHMLEIEDEAA